MAKKFGKFLIAATVVSAGVAALLALKKKAENDYCDEDMDDDYDDELFDVEHSHPTEDDADRTYVTIPSGELNIDITIDDDTEAINAVTDDDILEETAETGSDETKDDIDFLEDELEDELNHN